MICTYKNILLLPMKLTTYILALLCIALAGTSCTDEIQQHPADRENSVSDSHYFVIAGDNLQTRIAYSSIFHSTFESGDCLGVFSVDPDGRPAGTPNAEYRAVNIENVSDNTYRQVLEKVNPSDEMPEGPEAVGYSFIIYYPYDKNMTLERLKNLTYRVRENQSLPPSASSLGGYEASDLLWAVEVGGADQPDKVVVHFDHVMANVVLEIDDDMVDKAEDEGYEPVFVMNVPLEASGINLTEAKDKMHGMELAYTPSEEKENEVLMWDFDYVSSGRKVFRAVIPACWSIKGGTPFLKIKQDGQWKIFRLKEELEFKAGKNYVFTLTCSKPEQPDLNDDDSWVLDVVDPENGNKVGLLCREYLRYLKENKLHTGVEAANPDGSPTKCINSQAWVFYHLKENSGIPYLPDLNQGTVLRFIYDIDERYTGSPVAGVDQMGTARWPAPHVRKDQHGVFAADHGCFWARAGEASGWEHGGNSIAEGKYEYYMHGGTIYWDGTANQISKFMLPDSRITNEQAKKGYISIDRTTNKAMVAYGDLDEGKSKKALIIPHYLIDKREKVSGGIEVHKYPLVKIGYNQFWMSQSLRTETLNGMALTPYNKEGSPGVVFERGDILTAPGYIYAFETFGSDVYDPYNKPEQRKQQDSGYEAVLCYNKPAVQHENFVPRSEEPQTTYAMPTVEYINRMSSYFGHYFAAKLCTREIAPYVGENISVTKFQAVLNGQTYGSGGTLANAYVANISGFNLRAAGVFEPASFSFSSGAAALILKTENVGIDYFSLHIWAPFAQDNADLLKTNEYSYSPSSVSQYFAQVRFVMSFKEQIPIDNNGNTGSTRVVQGDKPYFSDNDRNVYVELE